MYATASHVPQWVVYQPLHLADNFANGVKEHEVGRSGFY